MKLSNIAASRTVVTTLRLASSLLAGSFALTGLAQAQVVQWTPYVGADWEYSSNVYYAPDAAQALPGSRPKTSGHLLTYLAGLDLRHQGEIGTTYLNGEGRKYEYSANVSQLNHDEYNGALGQIFGREMGNHVNVEVGGSRKLAPFISLDSTTTYAIETQRYGHVGGTVVLSGANALDAFVERRVSQTPLGSAVDYGFSDYLYRLGYLRSATRNLSYGIRVEEEDGHYDGLVGVSDYRQVIPEVNMAYKVAALVDLNAAFGFTRRSQEGLQTQTINTGSLDLRYQVGAKTSLQVGVARRAQPYYATAGTQVTMTYSAGINWAPTTNVSFELLGTRANSDVELAGTAVGTSRQDHDDFGSLTANWQVRPWLKLGAYGRRENRDSTLAAYRFDVSTAGITFRIQKPGQKL